VDSIVVAPGLRGDHRDVIRRAAGGRGRVEILAQPEMLRVGPPDRDVTLLVLDHSQRVESVHRAAVDRKPRARAGVIQVVREGVGRSRQSNAISYPWESAEVTIEGVVFLHNNNDMLNGAGRVTNPHADRTRGNCGQRYRSYSHDCYHRINPPQFDPPVRFVRGTLSAKCMFLSICAG
jgi:hypothetical protein